jgi:hypothetical protein
MEREKLIKTIMYSYEHTDELMMIIEDVIDQIGKIEKYTLNFMSFIRNCGKIIIIPDEEEKSYYNQAPSCKIAMIELGLQFFTPSISYYHRKDMERIDSYFENKYCATKRKKHIKNEEEIFAELKNNSVIDKEIIK